MQQVGIRNIYVDYLLSTAGTISATDLSEVLDGRYSHDQISRMLYGGGVSTDKALYLKGKRLIANPAAGAKTVVTLSIDDSIQEKPYSAVNGLVACHWDHTKNRVVKGINFVSALWSDAKTSVPMSVQLVEKNWDGDQGAWKMDKSRNAFFQEMAARLTRSQKVQYVLADSWYASKDNMTFVYRRCQTHFIMALKTNRSAACRPKQAQQGRFTPLPELLLGKRAVKLYFKGLAFAVRVVKQVFKHEDGSSGTLYLASSDLELDYEAIFTLYQRRWQVEQYHKSLKNNCSLGKCQASSHTAQKSHFYAAALAFLLLETAKRCEDKNHFALMKQLNILTVKYGIKQVRKQLHTTSRQLKMAA